MADAAPLPPPLSRLALSEQLGAVLVAERQAADHPRLGAVPALRARMTPEQGWLLSQELYLRRQSLQQRFEHPQAWLLLVLQGSLALDLDGRDAPLLLDRAQQQLCLHRAATQEFTILQAPVRLLRLGLPLSLSFAPARFHGPVAMPLLEPMLQLIQQAHRDKAPESTRQRLLEALQAYCASELEPHGVQLRPSDADPVQDLLNWLQPRLGDELHLADLAAAVCLSARRLQELCQQRFGISPMDLLRQQRLDALHAQLLDPAHAGDRLGQLYRRWQLPDSAATRQAFEARFGDSPRGVRRRAAAGALAG